MPEPHSPSDGEVTDFPRFNGRCIPRFMGISSAEMSRDMANDAVGYFMAGRKIAAGEDFHGIIAFYRMPLNFVLAQTCELALKSSLAGKGWARKRRNHIRHDLVGLA